MDLSYLLTPLMAWFTAGTLKFILNSIKAGRPAFALIGYGGMPSNHSAIVTSVTVLLAMQEGIDHPAFGVAVALAFIVFLDAGSLRREVGRHARAINNLTSEHNSPSRLRERMGHTRIEILAGILVGGVVAFLAALF
jgi:hypothetical protein